MQKILIPGKETDPGTIPKMGYKSPRITTTSYL